MIKNHIAQCEGQDTILIYETQYNIYKLQYKVILRNINIEDAICFGGLNIIRLYCPMRIVGRNINLITHYEVIRHNIVL